MICKKCGAVNNDDALYCRECGENLPIDEVKDTIDETIDDANAVINETGEMIEGTEEKAGSFIEKIKSFGTAKLLAIVGGALAALAVLILVLSLLFGGGWKRLAKNVVTNSFNGKLEKVSSYMPSKYVKEMIDNLGLTNKEYKQKLKESGEDIKDALKKSGAKLKDVEIVGYKDLSEEAVKTLSKNLDMDVTKAKIAHVRTTVRQGGKTQVVDQDIYLVKVGGKWCLDPSHEFDMSDIDFSSILP